MHPVHSTGYGQIHIPFICITNKFYLPYFISINNAPKSYVLRMRFIIDLICTCIRSMCKPNVNKNKFHVDINMLQIDMNNILT